MRTHICGKIFQEKWKRGFGIFLCGSCAALLFWIPAIGSTFLGFANCCLSSSISRRRERGLELNIAIACLRNCAQWCRTTSLDSSLSVIGYKVLPHVWNERASHAIFSGTAGNAEQRLFRFFEIPFTRFMKLSKIEGQSFSSLWSKLYSSTDTYYKPLCLLSDNNRKWFPDKKLDKARSRLYRRRFLQVNTRWKALAEIYTMHSFAPFSNLNFFVKNRQNFFAIELMNIH